MRVPHLELAGINPREALQCVGDRSTPVTRSETLPSYDEDEESYSSSDELDEEEEDWDTEGDVEVMIEFCEIWTTLY